MHCLIPSKGAAALHTFEFVAIDILNYGIDGIYNKLLSVVST